MHFFFFNIFRFWQEGFWLQYLKFWGHHFISSWGIKDEKNKREWKFGPKACLACAVCSYQWKQAEAAGAPRGPWAVVVLHQPGGLPCGRCGGQESRTERKFRQIVTRQNGFHRLLWNRLICIKIYRSSASGLSSLKDAFAIVFALLILKTLSLQNSSFAYAEALLCGQSDRWTRGAPLRCQQFSLLVHRSPLTEPSYLRPAYDI